MNVVGRAVCIGLVCVVIAIGCATTEKEPTVTGAHPKFETLCSKCHTLDRVHQAHSVMTEEQMKAIARRMSEKEGSGFSLNDVDSIVREMY